MGWFAVAVGGQAVLGVVTLLPGVWLPLAARHQAMAMALFLAGVWTVWSFSGAADRR